MAVISLSGDLTLIFARAFVEFLKIVYGSAQMPYSTFRSVSLKKPYFSLIFIASLIFLYLFVSTLAKHSLSSNPLFLTKSLLKIGMVISFSFMLISFVIFKTSRLFSSSGTYGTFALLWAFSLLPTLSWFLITTIFYVLIPPPRTLSLQGQIFSGLFLIFSFACFAWKGILYYLSLRIGLLLNAKQIMLLSMLVLPLIFGYSYLLYKLQVFRVPFI